MRKRGSTVKGYQFRKGQTKMADRNLRVGNALVRPVKQQRKKSTRFPSPGDKRYHGPHNLAKSLGG